MNATVGYCNGSFINHYLKDVLNFEDVKVKSYNSTHRYAEGLNSGIERGGSEGGSRETPKFEKLRNTLEATHMDGMNMYIQAFPRKFSWLSDANKALMNVSESGKLKELEDAFLVSEKCLDDKSFPNEDESLSPRSFWILFELTFGASTLALAMYIIISIRQFNESHPEITNFFQLISAFITDQWHQMRQ
ncbi:hypothetical protein OSB04_031251 [Centaurea solstitialis]|uniref:Uncharacterized protein n=1 Tax=Centaurea solstitialis TaxID=347529 RepID=A0AA38SGP2_9ASTR|nr:hypothetical protein OSB04_031251 [Centaurea solstitialis]